MSLLLLALLSVGGAARAATSYDAFESFEDTWGEWTYDEDLACLPGCTWTRGMDLVKENAYDADWAVASWASGEHDDGTLWLERALSDADLEPGTYSVKLAFALYSFDYDEINPFPVLAYVGYDDPESELDFTIIGQTDTCVCWVEYVGEFTLEVPEISIPEDEIHAAFGWGVTWEGGAEYLMDAVHVSIEKL